MRREHRMNDNDEVISRLEGLGQWQPAPAATDRALERVRRALREPAVPPRSKPRRWRLPAFAAAVLIIGGGLGIWLMRSSPSARASLAEMQHVMKEARTVSFRQVTRLKGKPDQVTRMLIRSDGVVRSEESDGTYTVTDMPKFEALLVNPGKHEATRLRGVNVPQVNLYEMIKNLPADASARALAGKTIDGKKAFGVVVTLQGHELTVWADARTRLPIRMEAHQEEGEEAGDAVLDDFHFDTLIDSNIFSMAAPTSYKVKTTGIATLPPPPSPDQAKQMVATPLVGLGPVRFRMKREEVEKLLGKPDAVEELGPSHGFHLNYGSRGFFISGGKTNGVFTISCVSQICVVVRVHDFAGRTDKGIRLRASEAEIIKAYGKPDQRTTNRGSTYLEYRKLNTSFTLFDDKLVEILLMRPPPGK